MTILEVLQSGLANYRTTLLGVAAGSTNYIGTVGGQLPQTPHDWLVLLVSALIAILGLLTKDATTGSQPANPVAPVPAPVQLAPAAPGTPMVPVAKP
jgi:hypothetical protein